MNSTTLGPASRFATAVRAELRDLPPDEVDDLTDGLEADLAERAADESTPDFGDPIVYANELRSSAGLPPRPAHRPTTLAGALLGAWNEFVGGLREVYSHPVIARIGAFFVSLRPVWWLIRAWAFYGILTWMFGVPSLQLTPLTFVLGVGTIIASVQFGRGRWMRRRWMRRALFGVNIVLVLASPLILLATTAVFGSQVQNAYADGANDAAHDQNGLTANGRQITNIFAYGADGKPLSQVQLYDQAGRPLYTVADPSSLTSETDPALVPNDGIHGRGGWNIYPLGFLSDNQLTTYGEPKHNAKPTPSVLRDLLVAPVKSSRPATAGRTATPVPTTTPTPSPTVAP